MKNELSDKINESEINPEVLKAVRIKNSQTERYEDRTFCPRQGVFEDGICPCEWVLPEEGRDYQLTYDPEEVLRCKEVNLEEGICSNYKLRVIKEHTGCICDCDKPT
jgi:hypothetical protein